MTSAVVQQLAHELDVIEKTGLAEFFLICWDIMRFAREKGIPAQGRGSAADSIVAYVLGITRVDPIRHRLLFERFINEGRTTYPDVDIDFSSERREEVIQYVYERYGPEHTGMVCNLVTYRARSAVREVGYALGFPRPLVDRVAKALETYDSVMVRRDLEADGGFGQFFVRPGEGEGGMGTARGRGGCCSRGGGRRRARPGRRDGPVAALAGRPVPGRGRRAAERTAGPARRPDRTAPPARCRRLLRRGAAPLASAPISPLTNPGGDNGDIGANPCHSPTGVVIERSIGLAPSSQPTTDTEPASVRAGEEPSPDSIGSIRPAGSDNRLASTTPVGIRQFPRPVSPTGRTPATMLPDELAPRTTIRGGGPSDDKGGPGDTPVSVAWLRGLNRGHPPNRTRGGVEILHGRDLRPEPTNPERSWGESSHPENVADVLLPPPTIGGHRIDPESGMYLAPDRVDGRVVDRAASKGRCSGRRRSPRTGGSDPCRSAGAAAAGLEGCPRGAGTGPRTPHRLHAGPLGLGALARVLRPDGRLPAPPLDPQRRHARHGRAAHRHRAAGAGHDAQPRRDPVRQARHRDAQAHQARPARPGHAGRDRRDAPADRARLRRLPRPRPHAGGDPRGLRDAPGGRHRGRLPGGESGADADPAEVAARRASTTSWSRSRSSGRAPSRATRSIRTCAASRAWSP